MGFSVFVTEHYFRVEQDSVPFLNKDKLNILIRVSPDDSDLVQILETSEDQAIRNVWLQADYTEFDSPTGSTAATVVSNIQALFTVTTDSAITGLTGDVTASGPGNVPATISNDAVTNAKAANMATNTIKGRITAGTGDPEDLSASQALSILGLNNWIDYSGSITFGGFSGTPTVTFCRYTLIGKTCVFALQMSAGTSNSTAFTLTLPFAAAQRVYGYGQYVNNGVVGTAPVMARTTSGSATLDLFTSWAGGTWRNSGSKYANINIIFETQ